MIAKTDAMMRELSETMKARKVGKYYLAIVAGKVKERKFTIESYIGRDPHDRQKMTAKNPITTNNQNISWIKNRPQYQC